MMARSSTLLLLLISVLGVFANTLGKNMAVESVPDSVTDAEFVNGIWFQEIDASKATTMTDKDVQDAAENGWKDTQTKAATVKLPPHWPNGLAKPKVAVALFIPGHGTIIATSIKPAKGSSQTTAQTCKTITWGKDHNKKANCAEPNAVSIAVQLGWIKDAKSVPEGSKMAIYGKPGKTEGFQQPCADNDKGPGCETLIKEVEPKLKVVNPTTKRAVVFEV